MPTIDSEQAKLIENLLAKTEEELLTELGDYVRQSSFGVDASSPKAKEVLGRRWLERNSARLIDLICPHQDELNKYKDKIGIESVIIVADWITHHFAGIPIFVISVLILKAGIHQLCRGYNVESA